MNVKICFSFLVSIICFILSASQLPAGVKVSPSGSLLFEGGKFEVCAYTPRWRGFSNADFKNVKNNISRQGGTLTAEFDKHDLRGKFTLTLVPVDDNSFDLKGKFEFEKPSHLAQISASLEFPVKDLKISFDGKKVSFKKSVTKKDKATVAWRKFKTCEIQSLGNQVLTVTSEKNNTAQIQDNRVFSPHYDHGAVRLFFTPGNGKAVKEAEVALRIRVKYLKTQPVDISAAADCNMADDPAAGKPGWTRQGAGNDFSTFNARKISVYGVDFLIPDRKVIAVGGEQRKIRKECRLKLPETKGMKALHILQNCAWPTAGAVGSITVCYKDGSQEKITVSGVNDCGNWVGPRAKNNGMLAWKELNELGRSLGIYLSTYALKKSDPTELIFTISPDRASTFWAVFGVTLGEDTLGLPEVADRTYTYNANSEWKTLSFTNNVKKGSPLDFSFMLDAPAGKYGFVFAAKDGTMRFEKAPEKRLKLHGINVCFEANFPPKEWADKMAEHFAALGYNAVRFHHYDSTVIDKKAGNSTTLNKEMMDRFDYFVSVLIKKGFYLSTDFYSTRAFDPKEGFPKITSKALYVLDQRARENLKTFIRNFVTHVNPYTGRSLAQEPALVSVNLINEDNLNWVWNSSSLSRKLFAEKFEEYKKTHNCPNAVTETSDRHFMAFLNGLQAKTHKELYDFCKKELKMKALLTSCNFQNQTYLVDLRSRMDFADNHMYHAHPVFGGKSWQSKAMYTQESPLETIAALPRVLMVSRLTGMPYWMTEYNYCKPNRTRHEGAALIGAYCALQDWDAIFRFTYAHSMKRVRGERPQSEMFDAAVNPIMQLSDRVIAVLFLRGDVRPAENEFSYAVNTNFTDQKVPVEFHANFSKLGLISRIGARMPQKTLPAGVKNIRDIAGFSDVPPAIASEWKKLVTKSEAKSDTGEIAIDGKKRTFIVNTPKSECVTLTGGNLSTGGVLNVRNARYPQTAALMSLDNKPLAESKRMLLLHFGNSVETGVVHSDRGGMTQIEKQGTFPLLLHNISADITLTSGKPFEVYALLFDGSRAGKVTVKNNTFKASAGLFKGGVVGYEIIK